MNDFLLAQEGLAIYSGIWLALIGGAIGLPIPEDVPLILAGIFVHQGKADLTAISLICYAGIIVGDLIIYSVGRKFGPSVFEREWFGRRISKVRVEQAKLSLERKSLLMIFIARHLFYLRSITFLTCGAVKMRLSLFLLADAAAALISVPLMLAIGYLFAEHIEAAFKFFHQIKTISLVLSIALILLVLVYVRIRRRDVQ